MITISEREAQENGLTVIKTDKVDNSERPIKETVTVENSESETKKTVTIPKLSRRQEFESRAKAIGKIRFIKLEIRPDFRCSVCKGKGNNSLVFKDKNNKTVLLGWSCLKYFGIAKATIKAKIS